jgi:DNA-directed RNA polymerase sigma subunit (sigma70/sigma32)
MYYICYMSMVHWQNSECTRNDENIAKIKRAIDEDRRKTIDQISEETNISWSRVQRILTEF